MNLYGGSQPDSYSLIQNVYTVKDNMSMRYGIDKCWVLAMPRGKESECEGITIGSEEVIGKIDDDGCRYLDIMERTDICQERMKGSVKINILNLLDKLSSRN